MFSRDLASLFGGDGESNGGERVETDGGQTTSAATTGLPGDDRDPDTEALVSGAFDRLRDELDEETHETIATVEGELQAELATASAGGRADEATSPTGDSETVDDLPIDFHDVVHHVGTPLFILDANGDIVTWNRSLAGLTGVEEAAAKSMEMASMAFYPDGRRGKTLADKVLDAPERTHVEYDVPKVEDAAFTLYRDTSVMRDQYGEDRHISFSAAPLYADGELVAVVEMVQDRTDDARRHEAVSDLVGELEATMTAMGRGNLGARASFDDEEGRRYVDGALLDVIDALNEMAEQFDRLTGQVDTQTANLASAIDQTASAARTVERQVAEQADALDTAADNVQNVSAGMQQVAATSSEVASAAERALTAAEDGADASEAVHEVTDGLTKTSESLVDSVADLESRMDEVSDVAEVIADVAEQTNMLALNANIEAARAGESGSGFAVVADEVKALANETSDHAAEISDSIDTIQAQATETAEMVDDSHEQVERAETEIQAALDALDEITTAVEAATSGIQEVADANGGQASAVEDITTMIEDAKVHAEEAEAATEEIVSATDQQSEAVADLANDVADLTDDTGR
ncbi:methyl-accepting chemotaxis protein [Haloarcula nitratireducens]|uniref:PAS domain-containing protein n=1 Tax=Haloarcula nitratireducens TaxID=2487749 RepID=A0AAW4PAP1_9EURY|nr:methyl-accepting chemotaxis protein [Halomicroarcula nitratireducens]MBX0294817.1 PAS domain-containing protein [Halomicroarcula nitratireducens]